MFLQPFWAALGFLSALWFGRLLAVDKEQLKRSKPYFGAVGLLLGALLVVLDMILVRIFPVPVASLIEVGALVVMSGGLHLDGLADSADGFLSARPRERILEIMRDSRCGTMAIIVLFFVLGLKVLALSSIEVAVTRSLFLWLWPVFGRLTMVGIMEFLPYARSGGLGLLFGDRKCFGPWIIQVLLLVGVSCGVLGVLRGLVLALVAGGIGLWSGRYSFKKIGGYTGDTLGATCELVECGVVLAMVVSFV